MPTSVLEGDEVKEINFSRVFISKLFGQDVTRKIQSTATAAEVNVDEEEEINFLTAKFAQVLTPTMVDDDDDEVEAARL